MRSAASGSKCFLWSIGSTIALLLFTVGLFAQAPSTPPATNGNPDTSISPDKSSNPQSPTSGPEPVGQEPSGNDQSMFFLKKQSPEVLQHPHTRNEHHTSCPHLANSAFEQFETAH